MFCDAPLRRGWVCLDGINEVDALKVVVIKAYRNMYFIRNTISISKLCKRAGINRGTFYLHYQDKYQMVDSLKNDIISQLSSYSMFEAENEYPKKLMIAKFHILRANERLINALTKSHYMDFREAIREYITTIILSDKQKAATQRFLEENFHIPQKYALEIFLSSVEGIISLWIAGGAQEEPEELTDIILTTYNYDYLR